MNLNNNTKALTETAVVTALMVVFALVGVYFLNIIIVLYPIPFIILGVRHGTKYNILSLVVSSLVLGVLTSIVLGIFLFVFLGFMSILLTYMLKRKYSTSQILMLTAGILLISILVALTLFNFITGTSLISDMENFIDEAIESSYEEVKDMGFTSYEQEEVKKIIETFYEYFVLLMPFIIITSSLFISYINFWISVAILRRLGDKTKVVPRFKRFTLPSNIILGTSVIIICTFIIGYFEILYYETIILNVVALMTFVFFLQGLAVVAFLIDKLTINKIFKWIFLGLAVINVFLNMIIALAGFLDALLDFRKIRQVNKP